MGGYGGGRLSPPAHHEVEPAEYAQFVDSQELNADRRERARARSFSGPGERERARARERERERELENISSLILCGGARHAASAHAAGAEGPF